MITFEVQKGHPSSSVWSPGWRWADWRWGGQPGGYCCKLGERKQCPTKGREGVEDRRDDQEVDSMFGDSLNVRRGRRGCLECSLVI